MRRRSLLVVPAVLTTLLLAFTAVAAAVTYQANVRPGYEGDGDLIVILVIGSDSGPPFRKGNPAEGLADALHLVAVDPDEPAATIVDIPRDTYVNGQKLNSALALGGPEQLRNVVEELSGVPIDFWALTSFGGLVELVDSAGGYTVDVDVTLENEDAKSNIEAGVQKLDGKQMLAFTRDRKSLPDGDFGRTRHQGELLVAAHEDLTQRSLGELVTLAASFSRNTITDIPPQDVLPLGLLASKLDPDDVLQVPLQGAIETIGTESVVQLDPGDTFERIAAGRAGP